MIGFGVAAFPILPDGLERFDRTIASVHHFACGIILPTRWLFQKVRVTDCPQCINVPLSHEMKVPHKHKEKGQHEGHGQKDPRKGKI